MPEHELAVTKANTPEVSNQEIEQLQKELGLVGMPEDMLPKLIKLGVGVQERGLVKLANGCILVTTQWMLDAAKIVHTKIKNRNRTVEEIRSLSYALGYLTRNTQQNILATIKQEGIVAVAEQEQDKRRRKSFVPHATVGAAQNVQVINHNYHGEQPREPETTIKTEIAKSLKPV